MCMKLIKRETGFILFILCVIFVFSSCATTRKFDTSLPEVKVERVNEEGILRFGSGTLINPYMDIKSFGSGWVTDTFVTKIDLNLPEDRTVYIVAEMKTLDRKITVAEPKDVDSLTKFWEANTEKDILYAKYYNKKMTTIRYSCVPAFSFKQKAGRITYYLPFIGSHPIKRPAKIYVQVSTGKGEPVIFETIIE